MKILVIGGAGYIGSHVCKALLNDKNSVTVFDNLSSGLKSNILPDSKFIKGNILNYKVLTKALKGMDAVIHLAAFKAAGESMITPEKYSVNNITGTINILNAMVETGVKKIVFSSSAAVYGEPEYLPIDEKHRKKPENYYGYTKLAIEEILSWYDKLKGIKYSALRYFNAAGYDPEGVCVGLERNPANLLPVIMEVACGMRKRLSVFGSDYDTKDGTCIRDYVHVSDLADAHVNSLHYIKNRGESLTVNLGCGEGISVKEMLDSAREITGREIPADYVPRRAGDPEGLIASSKLAADKIGWNPKYSDVKTLLDTTWKAYLINGK